MRKAQSTIAGRNAAYKEMVEAMKVVPTLTVEQIAKKITEIYFFSYYIGERTREQIIADYSLALASRIIHA